MFKRIRRSLGLVVLLLLLPMSILAAPVGKISHLEGEADVAREGGKAVIVKLADPVSVGDILRTKAKGKVEVTFLDGNVIWIAEKSRLKITAYEHKEGQKNAFDLFRGKVRAIVNSMAKQSSLELNTPTATCGVRGTIFIGYFTNGISGFVFERGEGYGFNRTMPSIIVPILAGQLMQVTAPNKPPVVGPASAIEMNRHLQDTSGSVGTTIASTAQTTVPPPPPPPPPPPLSLSAVMRNSFITTVPTTIATTTVRPTTVPTTILTTVPPTTTTIPTTAATTIPTTSIATTTVAPTTVSTTVPATTVLPTTAPTTSSTTMATTTGSTTTIPTTAETTVPPTTAPTTTTSVATTVPPTTSTTTTSVATTTTGSTTTIPTTAETTVPPTTAPTTTTSVATTVPPTTSTTTTSVATTTTVLPSLPITLRMDSSDPAPLIVSETRKESGGTWQSSLEVNKAASWITSRVQPNETARYWTNYSGVDWSAATDTPKELGTVAGAKADWVTATTAVIGGKITGLFNPKSATWQATTLGALMETAAFMNRVKGMSAADRAAFYQATNIPCFQVGATDLRGYSDLRGGSINMQYVKDPRDGTIDVNKGILNATFFAPTSGATPQIWASGSVNGDFTGTPAVGHTVALEGYQPGTATLNGISANFIIQKWGTAVGDSWGAKITNGTVPANALPNFPNTNGITFEGGAAGIIKENKPDGKFIGTAAGIVK